MRKVGGIPGRPAENPIKLKGVLVRDSSGDRKERFKEDANTNNSGVTLKDEDFEELLKRLRIADFLHSEYPLGEITYQLEKVVFSQSLASDNTDAQLALQKFISFLEKGARLGRTSKILERKIIGTLIAALSDTLSEHPQLLSAVKESMNDIEASELSGPGISKSLAHGNRGGPLNRKRTGSVQGFGLYFSRRRLLPSLLKVRKCLRSRAFRSFADLELFGIVRETKDLNLQNLTDDDVFDRVREQDEAIFANMLSDSNNINRRKPTLFGEYIYLSRTCEAWWD